MPELYCRKSQNFYPVNGILHGIMLKCRNKITAKHTSCRIRYFI